MFTGTSNQLGDFRAGAAAAAFGTIPAVLIGGFCTIAVVLVSTRIFRELYQADRYGPAKSQSLISARMDAPVDPQSDFKTQSGDDTLDETRVST
jgi:hypothetical protein